MSAIWGIVAPDQNKGLPENCCRLFEDSYRSTCKIDRYESVRTKNACFGCGIQYLTEESVRECLPIYNEERGILFTVDCILDNRPEVIESLLSQNYTREQLTDAPDGTLMYLSYLAYGAECVSLFRGLFSFAVWEEQSRSLTLFSDHTASRCLYYLRTDRLIAFSTQMKPLLKLFPNATPNIDYYKDFLLANPSLIYIVPGETPYKEISLLRPASRLCIRGTEQTYDSYWTPCTQTGVSCNSPQEYSEYFFTLYRDCVRDTLRSRGETGIAMSGGLDSSGIGVLAAQELDKSGKNLYSYTYVPYEPLQHNRIGNYILDESVLVQEITKNYPNISATYLNNHGRNVFQDMGACSKLLEIPYKTGAFSEHLELCQAGAAAGCKVFLNGCFGNTSVSFGHISNGLYHLYREKNLSAFFSLLSRYAKHERQSRGKLLYQTLHRFHAFEARPKEFASYFVPANIFVTPSILQDYDLTGRFSADPHILLSYGFLTGKEYPDYLWSASLLMYLGIYETQFGLATGMLLRDPTKDSRILEFCCRLPFSLFTYHGTPRWLIRSSFASLLPKSVLEPWEQHGIQGADLTQRVRRDWTILKPELLRHLSYEFPYQFLDKERLRTMIERFESEPKQNERALTHLCAVEGLVRYLYPDTDS